MEESLDDLFNEYCKLQRKKRWDESLQILEKCIELDPRHNIIHNALIEIYAIKGRINDIVKEHLRYIEALSLREEYDKVKTIIPILLNITRERERTIKKLINIFKKDRFINDFYAMTLLLVRLYLQEGKWDQAGEILKKIYEYKPENFEIRMEMATLFSHLQMPEFSLSVLKETLLDCIRKKHHNLVEQADKYIMRITRSEFIVHLMLGEVYHQALELEKAAEQYAAALKIEKNNGKAMLGLANVLLLNNQFDLAIKAYQKVLALNSAEQIALEGIIRSYLHIGKCNQALKYMIDLSKIYIRKAKYGNAYELLKKILAIDKDNSIAANEIERLKKRGLLPDMDFEKKAAQPELLKPEEGVKVEMAKSNKGIMGGKRVISRLIKGKPEKRHPLKGFATHKAPADKNDVSWRELKEGEEDFSHLIDNEEEREIILPELEGQNEIEAVVLEKEQIQIDTEGLSEGRRLPYLQEQSAIPNKDLPSIREQVPYLEEQPVELAGIGEEACKLDFRMFLPVDATIVEQAPCPTSTENIEEDLPDDSFLDLIMSEISEEEAQATPSLKLPEMETDYSIQSKEDIQDLYSMLEKLSSIKFGGIEKADSSDRKGVITQKTLAAGQKPATPQERNDDSKTVLEKIYGILDKLAASIVFYEKKIFLAVLSNEGQLLWKSKKSRNEMWPAHSTSPENLLLSLLNHELLNREKRFLSWIFEFEKGTFFLYSIDFDTFLLLNVNSTERTDMWQQKLKAAQENLSKLLLNR